MAVTSTLERSVHAFAAAMTGSAREEPPGDTRGLLGDGADADTAERNRTRAAGRIMK
jgi:hypothetical protein